MSKIKMFEAINHNRRGFLFNAAMTLAAAPLVTMGIADAQSSKTNPGELPRELPPIKPGTNTSFSSLSRSTPASSTLDTLKPALPMVPR